LKKPTYLNREVIQFIHDVATTDTARRACTKLLTSHPKFMEATEC
jgi:hypothetical protein